MAKIRGMISHEVAGEASPPSTQASTVSPTRTTDVSRCPMARSLGHTRRVASTSAPTVAPLPRMIARAAKPTTSAWNSA